MLHTPRRPTSLVPVAEKLHAVHVASGILCIARVVVLHKAIAVLERDLINLRRQQQQQVSDGAVV
jgi:hypothetical protein